MKWTDEQENAKPDHPGGRQRQGRRRRVQAGGLSAELSVTQHRHVPGVTSALGYNDLVVQLEGKAGEYGAEVRGSSREVPSVRFSARLSHTRISVG